MGFLNFKCFFCRKLVSFRIVSVPLWGFLISNCFTVFIKIQMSLSFRPLVEFLNFKSRPCRISNHALSRSVLRGKIKMARYTRTYILIFSANTLFSRCGGKSPIKQSRFLLLYHRPSPDRNLFLLIKTYHNHPGLIPHLQSPLSVHLRP